jgi:hypothetical protein
MRFALAALTLAVAVAAKHNVAKHSLKHHATFNRNLRSSSVWAAYVRSNRSHAKNTANMMKKRAYFVAKYFAARRYVVKATGVRNARHASLRKASAHKKASFNHANGWSRRTAFLLKVYRSRNKAL